MHADFSVELGRNDPALELPWSSEDPSVRYFDLKNSPELVLQIPEAVKHPELNAFLLRINAPGFPLATAKCDAWFSREISLEEEVFGADRKFVSYVDLVFVDEDTCCSFEKHESFAKELCRLLGHAPDIAATVEMVIRRCYYHRECVVSQDGPGHVAKPLRRNAANHQTTPSRVESLRSAGDAQTNASQRIHARGRQLEPADTFEQARPDEARSLDAPSACISGFCLTAYVTGFGDSDHEPHRRWEIALALLQHALMQLACT
jgi:hypothetical protein